MSLFSEGG